MISYDHIIGIDPDVDKSGVAYLHKPTKNLELTKLSFPLLVDYLKFLKNSLDGTSNKIIVVVEAGWLVSKSNYHGVYGNAGQAVAKKVGANHQVGKLIIETCTHLGIDVVEQKPLAKSWKGRDKKITHEEFAYFTGISGRTSQDERDAGLIAWNYAGLPIRIKVGK